MMNEPNHLQSNGHRTSKSPHQTRGNRTTSRILLVVVSIVTVLLGTILVMSGEGIISLEGSPFANASQTARQDSCLSGRG